MPRTRNGSGTQTESQSGSVDVESGATRAEEITVARILAAGEAGAPVMAPPGTRGVAATAGETAAEVKGTWSTVTVDATWSIQENRNAWFHVAGGVWKKVFSGTDGAFVLLTTLASQARQTGRQLVVREEADGLVHEIYLW